MLRRFLSGWAALVALALSLACRDQGAAPREPPADTTPSDTLFSGRLNIVLILTDDQRPNTLAYMPHTLALLAQQSVQFTNAFATTPLCCPSRASILTGLYTHNHGVLTNWSPLGGAPKFVDTSTVATWLQQAGYRTGLFGKYLNDYDLLRPLPYKPPGWNAWNVFITTGYDRYTLADDSVVRTFGPNPSDYSTELLANRAVAFIQGTPDSQPLFLYFAPYAPHSIATPAVQDQGSFSWLPPWRPPSYGEPDVSDKPAWIQSLSVVTPEKADSIDDFVRRQVETLQAVDRGVEQIVSALQQTGRLDSTVIIYASDNGLSWGEHRWFTKNCVYEECIRVLLMIRGPGIAPRQDAHLVGLVDLGPTIAHLAGVNPPGNVNGVSLVPLLKNPGTPWRSEILLEVLAKIQLGGEALFSAVRTDRYVYAELTTGERELYDLQTDPYQLTNLADDPGQAALIAALHAKLMVLVAE